MSLLDKSYFQLQLATPLATHSKASEPFQFLIESNSAIVVGYHSGIPCASKRLLLPPDDIEVEGELRVI